VLFHECNLKRCEIDRFPTNHGPYKSVLTGLRNLVGSYVKRVPNFFSLTHILLTTEDVQLVTYIPQWDQFNFCKSSKVSKGVFKNSVKFSIYVQWRPK